MSQLRKFTEEQHIKHKKNRKQDIIKMEESGKSRVVWFKKVNKLDDLLVKLKNEATRLYIISGVENRT